MGETKPRVKELMDAEKYHGFDHFGVSVVGISEDGMEALGDEYQIWPGNCSVLRFRCKKCGAEFYVEPKSKDPNAQTIPLCPAECNIDLLEKWVETQEKKRSS